jgi:hypothetical protein
MLFTVPNILKRLLFGVSKRHFTISVVAAQTYAMVGANKVLA